MFFNRRKRYNGDVAALLPAFGIDLEEAGAMKVLAILDRAWHEKYSVYEAALLVAHGFAYGLYDNKYYQRADKLARERILPIHTDWISKGIVRPELMAIFFTRLEERMAKFPPPLAV